MQSILTVTTEASSTDLTTLAAVKADMGIADADTSLDQKIEQNWIPDASAAIATYCDRVFGSESVVETFRIGTRDRACEPVLILERYPASEITSVVEDGTTVDATDYEYDVRTGLLYRTLGGRRRCGHN